MTNINGILNNLVNTTAFKNNANNKIHGENETITLFNNITNDGNINVTDSDGETFNLSMASVAKELNMSQDAIKAELEEAKKNDGTAAANAATAATGSGSASQLKAELDKLEQEKADNQEMMTEIEDKIADAEKKVRASLEEAAESMEKTEKEHKADVEKVIESQISQYKTDKQNGKNVTPETLSENVANAITEKGAPNFAKSVSEMMSADTNIKLMDNLLGVLNEHITLDKSFDSEIETKTQAYESAKAAEAAAASSKSCDPIGFQTTTESGEQVQFDFFIDKDGDKQLSNTNEFLGAQADADGRDGWSEMSSLDGKAGENADGKIDSKELAAGNVMVMVTGADGTQKAMSIADAEKQYGAIEINAKKDAQTNNNVGPKGFDDAKYNNERLGSFGLTIGGKTETGYQTRDDIDFLNDNFKFSKGVDGKGTKTEAGSVTKDDEFYSKYVEEVMPELKEALKQTKANLGFSKDLLALIDEVSGDSASNQVTAFTKELEEKQEAKKAQRQEETATADEAAQDDTQDKEQKVA